MGIGYVGQLHGKIVTLSSKQVRINKEDHTKLSDQLLSTLVYLILVINRRCCDARCMMQPSDGEMRLMVE